MSFDVNSKYYFKDKISEEVLCRYLSRSIVDSFLCYVDTDTKTVDDSIRMLINIGAKYVARAYAIFLPGVSDGKRFEIAKNDADFALVRKGIEKIHEKDPEIILEACVFETTWEGMNTFKIPEYVFEAFGLEYEERNFDYEKTVFAQEPFESLEKRISEGDYGRNMFGKGVHLPDITQTETQMFFYYRMCEFIKLGFEAIHIGQINLIGAKDEPNGFACWKSCLEKVREFAKTNARRGWVLINGHTPRHNFKDNENRLLSDFESFPTRVMCAPGETDHTITDETPQKCVINREYDTVYTKNPDGITPSGWKTEHLPYFVEFDNYGGKIGELNVAKNHWGLDEISWFASQPDNYRRQFLKDVYAEVKAFNRNGYLEMPGLRTAYFVLDGKHKTYYANSSEYFFEGFSDEEAIKRIWDEQAE